MIDRAIIRQVIENCRPFFDRWHEVETAPRWTCPECQFESNRHYTSHERTCSHYRGNK